ncbi:hypothetical protein GCM10028778_16300 [Barrientosiimonas marina]|uniref:Uncharacterized protein n=1 Tax=Lentibacillus kimchii TaxID=1542911 RepID=A0ABW2UXW6_9BACI
MILGVVLLSAGCSADSSESEPEDENITTLEAVLENTFTGPDKKLNRLTDPENINVPDDQDETNKVVSPADTELDSYSEDMYQSYFTEDMYEEYIGRYVYSYQAKENDDMNVADIDIKQKSSDEIIYDFTANVAYQKEDADKQHFKIKGQANFSEEGDIKRFKFNADDGLAKAVSES